MGKVKILIVEDEPIIAKDLFYTLKDLNYDPIGIAKDAEMALNIIVNNRPDFVLLDINLEGDENGFFIAEKLVNQYNIPFMFISSLSDMDTLKQAKNYLPMGYIVKPFDENDLIASLEIAIHKLTQSQNKSQDSVPSYVFLKEGYTFYKVLIDDIIYIEALDNYSQFITIKKKYTLALTLKGAQEKLRRWNFIRTHRSFLVNPNRINKISENHITLEKFKIPISRRNKKMLLEQLNQL